jgi:hypothetical protein
MKTPSSKPNMSNAHHSTHPLGLRLKFGMAEKEANKSRRL